MGWKMLHDGASRRLEGWTNYELLQDGEKAMALRTVSAASTDAFVD